MSILPAFREHIRLRAEDRPGVYRMTGCEGDIPYVEKSVRTRSRILSYFNAWAGDKPDLLMRETRAVEWEYVPNEFAALLREMRLIQRIGRATTCSTSAVPPTASSSSPGSSRPAWPR